MAEEVTDNLEIENELKCADELITQEEKHYLDEANQECFIQSGSLDPSQLLNYSKRMYADLLPHTENDVLIPPETVWLLEQKLIDFVKLVLKEAEYSVRESSGRYRWSTVRKRKVAWGDPQKFNFQTGAELIYCALKGIPNLDIEMLFRRIDESGMTPFLEDVEMWDNGDKGDDEDELKRDKDDNDDDDDEEEEEDDENVDDDSDNNDNDD
jgi:hypothetical protein